MSAPTARGIAAAIGLTLVATALALAVAELVARGFVSHISRLDAAGPLEALEVGAHLIVRHDEQGRHFVPGARVMIHNAPLSDQDVALEIDSRGLRDREIPQQRRPGELRVLALGDSITAVDYLPVEQGWVDLLERALAPQWTRGPLEVVNAGLGNVGLADELKLFEDVGLALEPQVILLAFYLNDGNPSWSFSAEVAEESSRLRRYSVLADYVATNVALLRWRSEQAGNPFAWLRAQHELAWRTDRDALIQLAGMAGTDWGAAWSLPVWKSVDLGLEQLARLAAQTGARVVVAPFPVSFQVDADYLEDTPQRRLEGSVRKHGFGFFDVLPVLREHRQEALFYDQCHLAPRGNVLVAEALADFLARETLPALPPS
jgi:lysophospholipase L1-like esterase